MSCDLAVIGWCIFNEFEPIHILMFGGKGDCNNFFFKYPPLYMVQLPWWLVTWDLCTPALGAAAVLFHGMDMNGC